MYKVVNWTSVNFQLSNFKKNQNYYSVLDGDNGIK